MQQLSGMDASFIYFETPKSPGHIFSVYIYDQSSAPGGRVTFKGILNHLEERLHVSRTFRQRLVEVPMGIDHPYWIEDPEFDLEYHVRHIALPKPGDWRQLMIQVARLHSRPLDLTRPLWELYVIEGLDNIDGSAAGQLRHHDEDPPCRRRWSVAARDHQRRPRHDARRRAAQAGAALAAGGRAVGDGAPHPRRVQQRHPALALRPADGPRDTGRRPRRSPPAVGGDVVTGTAPRTRFSAALSGHKVVEARPLRAGCGQAHQGRGAGRHDQRRRHHRRRAARCGPISTRRASCPTHRCG